MQSSNVVYLVWNNTKKATANNFLANFERSRYTSGEKYKSYLKNNTILIFYVPFLFYFFHNIPFSLSLLFVSFYHYIIYYKVSIKTMECESWVEKKEIERKGKKKVKRSDRYDK